jgi:hypothetical protein
MEQDGGWLTMDCQQIEELSFGWREATAQWTNP